MIIKTANFIKAEKFLSDIIAKNGFGAVIADKGSGKTFIKRKVIGAYQERKNDYTVVEITSIEEDWKGTAALMRAMIADISGENARRDIESRRRQLRRILGDASSRTKVILAIDEAQDLHASSLRGIKKLHEIGFGMRDKLFSIVLFGQHSLKDKISDDELRPRIRRCMLGDLTKTEKPKFIENPDMFESGAMELFLRRTKNTPATIINAYEELCDLADDIGQRKISTELIKNYFSMSARDVIKESNMSLRALSADIEKHTGKNISPTTLSQISNGSYPGNMENLESILHEYSSKTAKAV